MHASVKFMIAIRSYLAQARGATGVEYGIMLAAIAGVITVIAFAVGTKVNASFSNFNALWT